VNFVLNYKTILNNNEFIEFGYIKGTFVIMTSFFLMTVFFGVFGIWGQQLFYTYNDLTFLERKKTFAEEYYCCIMESNKERPVSIKKIILRKFIYR
jgi:hypothetical protein